MVTEDVAQCPLCTSSRMEAWRSVPATWQRDTGVYAISRCLTCGHRYLSRRVPETDAAKLYEGYTGQYWSSDPGMRLLWRLQAGYRASRLVRTCPGAASVLDVGSGMPVFARRLRVRYSIPRVESLDVLSPEMLHELREIDCEAVHHNVLLNEFAKGEARYDVVTAYHSLEHSYDPAQFLGVLNTLLEQGGNLVLGVPHFDHVGLRVFGATHTSFHAPYHLHFFNVLTLRRLLKEAGFGVDRVETEWFFSSVNSATSLLTRLGMRELSRPRLGLTLPFLLVWPLAAIAEKVCPLGGCVLITARKLRD